MDPIVVADPDVEGFNAVAWQDNLRGVGLGSAVQRFGYTATRELFPCCGVATYWHVAGAWTGKVALLLPPCPVCVPLAGRSAAALTAMLRKVAEREPMAVIVAGDETRALHGEPEVKAWRHPDDVEAIEKAWEYLISDGDNAATRWVLDGRISIERRRGILDQLGRLAKAAGRSPEWWKRAYQRAGLQPPTSSLTVQVEDRLRRALGWEP
jgi:hypothetical protein